MGTTNLDEVVEDAKPFRILTALDVDEGPDLGGGEGYVLVVHHDLQLLPANPVWWRPVVVILFHDL